MVMTRIEAFKFPSMLDMGVGLDPFQLLEAALTSTSQLCILNPQSHNIFHQETYKMDTYTYLFPTKTKIQVTKETIQQQYIKNPFLSLNSSLK